jgi:outer membrane scaffolding protein for murein synthesis (MipA/OmpV family)
MKSARLVTLLGVLAANVAIAAEDKPLWELGAGIAAFSFPAYRGSDKQRSFLMPVPYFVYHGKFLKADRHGIRGSLFDSDRVDLTLSLSASPPTDSDDVAIRDGMPDLKPTAEFGPEIDVTLWRSADRTRFLKLRAPLRAAFTLEASPRAIGWIFSPNLNLDITDLPAMPGWNLGFVAGPIWATKKQHDYFYGVAPRYATSFRPAYEASGGYSGSQFLVSLSKRYEKTWVGAFVRYDTLTGASFIDSPLVARKHFAAAGIAVSWILGESTTRVRVDD